jgi:aarF domain-containing kinase
MEKVRFAADFMPVSQMYSVMERELGEDWRSKFLEFEDKPVSAASIGQVHYAKTLENETVAVKIQYPGIAESIYSDLNMLKMLLLMSKWLPKGLYLDRTIEVARKELTWETDYRRELEATEKFNQLMKGYDSSFLVPKVYRNLSTSKVLVTEWMDGVSLDRCITLPQSIRNKVNHIFSFTLIPHEFSFLSFHLDWGKITKIMYARIIYLQIYANRS